MNCTQDLPVAGSALRSGLKGSALLLSLIIYQRLEFWKPYWCPIKLVLVNYVEPTWVRALVCQIHRERVLGASLLGNLSGFPNRKALNSIVTQNDLTAVRLSTSPVRYEGIFRKATL